MKFRRYLILPIVVTVLAFFLASCGGGRSNVDEDFFDLNAQKESPKNKKKSDKDEIQDLEALLGITRDKPKETQKEKKKKDDGEILTLLGADEGKGNKAADIKPLEEPNQDPRMKKLLKDNEKLRKKLKQKDQEIKTLQNEIADLTKQLDNKVSGAATSVYTPAPVAASQSSYVNYSMDNTNVASYEDYKREYEQAYSLFNEKNYEAAIRKFEDLLKADTRNDLSDNAQYWIGEAHYMLKKYQQALVDFEKVFTFPKSNKNDYAQYKIAMCYYMLGNKARAREELKRFMDNYPQSPIYSKAESLLNRL